MLDAMIDSWSSFAFSQWNGAAFWPALPGGQAHEAGAGQFIDGRFDADHGSLRYKLYIPRSYSGAPMPLIVMLHGCGQDADDFAHGTRMNALAEKYHCLVLYPEQSSGANVNRCWNWFEQAHHQRGQGEPALIAGLSRHIMADYAVDANRVCVAGLSSGGAMAVILGRTYPDLFSAVGCHSGLAHGSARDHYGAMRAMRDGASPASLVRAVSGVSVPIIVFHGDMDTTVHFNNSYGVVQQSIDSYAAQFDAHSNAAHGNGALELREETGRMRGRGFTRSVHHGAAGEVVAEQWTVHGTGHAWSGGSARGSFTDANGPDASEEMLRFFMRR
ncbi:MAG: PHB depolymerase family esterase [Pseudomonadota bacterium]